MSVVNRQQFIAGLSKSGVLSEDVFKGWQAEISSDGDAVSLARDLVAKNLATKWQAKMLLKGAAKLTIGNFLLTERLGKSELGDFFAAFHPQLSRNVLIQYVNADLSRAAESRKKLFSLGSKLAELDHPNLLHVYDVDEEGERIYLVSEVGSAMPLSEHFEDNPTLSCPELAKLILGSLEGVEYAHSNGVVHSKISLKSLFIKRNGEAKIGELTRFAVNNAIAESPASAEDDIIALKDVAKKLLQRVPEDRRESKDFATLKNSLGLLLKDRDAAKAGLSELASAHVVSSDVLDSDVLLVVESDTILADDSPTFSLTSQQTAELDSTIALPPRKRVAPKKEETEPEPEPETAGGFVSVLKRNPIPAIAGAVIAGLLLIGGGVFAASGFLAKPVETAAASGISDAPLAAVAGTKGSAIDPEANRKAIEAMFGGNEDDDASVEKTKPVSHEVKAAKKTRRKPAKDMAKAEEPSEPEEAEVAETPVEKPNSAAAKEKPTAAPKQRPEVAKAKPKPKPQQKNSSELKKGDNPFTKAKFAKYVDLPALDSTDQISFGKLILEKRHLLGAEILSATNAHRSKPVFSMERSADDRQSWDIGFSPKKKVKPTTIARLQKTADSVKFNWLPAVAEFSAAEALRNCRIKLSTPQNSHWFSLRKPIKIEGFKLGEKTGTVEVELDLPGLPIPSSLSGTLFRLRLKADRAKRERISVEPTEIVGSVARMHFSDDRDRYISLDVSATMKKTMKVRAAIVFKPDPSRRGATIKDPSTLKVKYTDPLRYRAQQLLNQAEAAKKQLDANVNKQPRGKKMSQAAQDRFMKPYLDAAKAAVGKAELTDAYDNLIPQVADRDIPIVIIYNLNDQHRIVLAYSGSVEGIK